MKYTLLLLLIFTSCQVNDVSVEGVEVFVQNPNIAKNIGTYVWAEVEPSFATDPSITWTVSNNVVSLDDRSIRVENFGTAIITGTTNDGGYSDSVEVWTSPAGYWSDSGTNNLVLYENGAYILDLYGSDSSGFWFSQNGEITLTEFPGSIEVLINENYYDQVISFTAAENNAISGVSTAVDFEWVTTAF